MAAKNKPLAMYISMPYGDPMATVRTTSAKLKKVMTERKQAKKTALGSPANDPKAQDIKDWPSTGEAARMLNVHPRTLRKWNQEGDIEAVQDENGIWRFDPTLLEDLSSKRGDDVSAMMGQSVALVVGKATELTSQSQNNAQAFADKHLAQSDIVFEQLCKNADILREENVSLRLYIRELEQDRRESRKEVEDAQGKVHDRKLKELELTKNEKRIDWAMNAFVTLAGPSVLAKLGIPVTGPIPPIPAGTPSELPASPWKTQATESADDYLRRLETNCIILIANIDEDRFRLLCQVATPEEVEGLTEVREVIRRLRASKDAEHKTG